jgi:hypothetical protein
MLLLDTRYTSGRHTDLVLDLALSLRLQGRHSFQDVNLLNCSLQFREFLLLLVNSVMKHILKCYTIRAQLKFVWRLMY